MCQDSFLEVARPRDSYCLALLGLAPPGPTWKVPEGGHGLSTPSGSLDPRTDVKGAESVAPLLS